jgi:VCBS repeat-containing protein
MPFSARAFAGTGDPASFFPPIAARATSPLRGLPGMLESVLALNGLDTQVFNATGPSSAPQFDSTDYITVPDAHLLFNGEFKRVGSSGLKITGDDGKSFFIENYFDGETHKHLLSPEGAMLSAHAVQALAGPLAPGQFAQAGAQPAAQAVIGRVDAMSGSCTVVRNGVTVALNVGDNVRKGDVVQTSSSSAISVVFTDGSTFSLSANARMVLDEFVYSAGGTNNSAVINLVQGTFSFVAGQVAKTGDMKVETPVATMGIRGTAVLVEISANDGQTKFSVMVEPNGVTGSFNLYNKTNGALIGTVNNSQIGWLVTPAGPLQVVAQQVDKTPAQLQQELGIVQQLFTIFNNYQQNPIDPNQQQDPGQRGDNSGPQNTGSVGSGGGPGSNPPINYTVTITQIPNGNTPQNPQNPPGTPNPNTNTNTPNPNAAGPDGGPSVPLPTGTYHVINGTTGDDHIIGTPGNDIVYAGSGNDLITAGHGGGDDIYDGGTDHDKIEFPSSHADITFQLNVRNRMLDGGEVVKESTADSAETGHDVFFRIEEVVGGQGNDTFVLHDTGNWKIDGGAGNDVVRLDGSVNIRDGATTLELSNVEIIDLNKTDANIIDIDLQGVIDANEDHTLVITGNSQDIVNFLNTERTDGHWVKVASDSQHPGFDKYEFQPSRQISAFLLTEGGGNPPAPLATVYLEAGINAGGEVQHEIIENVSVIVDAPKDGGISPASLVQDLLGSEVNGWGFDEDSGQPFVNLHIDGNLYYRIFGNFTFAEGGEAFGIESGNVSRIEIATLEISDNEISSWNRLVNANGFEVSASDFFDAVASHNEATLDTIFSTVSYSFFGSDDDDTLVGSDFRDILNGRFGDDTMTGNGGRDTFVYTAGNDVITDFTIGSDKIDLTAFHYIHSMADIGSRAHYDAETGTTTITLYNDVTDAYETLTLDGVQLNALSNSDFVFYAPPPVVENGANQNWQDISTTEFKVLTGESAPAAFDKTGWSTPNGAVEYEGHYYKFISGNMTWDNARMAALAMGGYLANITDASENSFILSSVTHGQFAWIGANDAFTEGTWIWTDGAEASKVFWQNGASVGNSYAGWWGSEPNNDGGVGNYAYIDHNGAWTDVPNNSGNPAGYLVEFSTYTRTGTYGTVSYNIDTGLLTYKLDDNDPDTQALNSGDTVTDTFELVFIDANGDPITRTATFTIKGNNDAPAVHVENTWTEEAGANTKLSGLFVTDVDAGPNELFSATAVSQHGSLAMAAPGIVDGDPDAPGLQFAGVTLAQLNSALGKGVIYTELQTYSPGLTDMVTLTVTDAHGASDIVNFIFNIGDTAVDLAGTYGKDVLFSTGNNESLTGGGGNDTFVFSTHHIETPELTYTVGPGEHVVTDFIQGEDKIALFDLAEDFQHLTITMAQDGSKQLDFSSTYGPNQIITLQGFTGTLTEHDFIFRPLLLEA